MKEESFKQLLNDIHVYRTNLLNNSKKKRTANSDDRLYQFKRLASLNKESAGSTAIKLGAKHFTDIIDMLDKSHKNADDMDYLKELIADVHNYLDFAFACALDESTPAYIIDPGISLDDFTTFPGQIIRTNASNTKSPMEVRV